VRPVCDASPDVGVCGGPEKLIKMTTISLTMATAAESRRSQPGVPLTLILPDHLRNVSVPIPSSRGEHRR
jgi:hypothetical protein